MVFLLIFVCCLSSLVYAQDMDGDISEQISPEGCCRQDYEGTHHPWTVLLEYNVRTERKMYGCQGALLNKRYVITAAHCIQGIPNRITLSGVVVGDANALCSTTGGHTECKSVIPVEEAVAHPEYNGKTKHNDIGIIRLAKDVSLTGKDALPICLPLSDMKSRTFVGERLTQTIRDANNVTNLALEEVPLPVVSNSACSQLYQKSRMQITEGQLCAGGHQGKGKDTCRGDGGGALVLVDGACHYVVGIVSYGPSVCGLSEFPSVYTRVTEYLPWIISNIRQ